MRNQRVSQPVYVGRLAPTPSGWLHSGHACTFALASLRARQAGGLLRLRIEDLDPNRCKPEYVDGVLDDLEWLGIGWDALPGTARGFVQQSEQLERYQRELVRWARAGWIYPSRVSRRELREHSSAKVSPDGEIVFPSELREAVCPEDWTPDPDGNCFRTNWRWKVPFGKGVRFNDLHSGLKSYVAGRDFGDFLVWSKDGMPAYEMAVVLDDIHGGINEVVRGEDLLVSTARQLLVYEKLGCPPPSWYHGPLVKDANGVRLAKSFDSESIRSYRERGWTAVQFWEKIKGLGFPEVADWMNNCSDASEARRDGWG